MSCTRHICGLNPLAGLLHAWEALTALLIVLQKGWGKSRKRAKYGFGEYGFKHRTQWAFWGSPSSRERTQWVPLSLLFVCKRELSPSFSQNSPSLPQNSANSLFWNSTLETVFRPFPKKGLNNQKAKKSLPKSDRKRETGSQEVTEEESESPTRFCLPPLRNVD